MKELEFKSQICTTKEQSQRLLELGLKPETADMVYHYTNSRVEFMQWELKTKPPTLRGKFWTEERIARLARRGESGEAVFDKLWGKDIPAWSLSRLIELLPKCIERIGEPDSTFEIESFNQCWFVSYFEEEADDIRDCLYSTKGEELFEAVISMIKLLIKNNYFNKDYLI